MQKWARKSQYRQKEIQICVNWHKFVWPGPHLLATIMMTIKIHNSYQNISINKHHLFHILNQERCYHYQLIFYMVTVIYISKRRKKQEVTSQMPNKVFQSLILLVGTHTLHRWRQSIPLLFMYFCPWTASEKIHDAYVRQASLCLGEPKLMVKLL